MDPAHPHQAAGGGRTDHPHDEQADTLEGWKSIAAYLGRDIRTVQRWELNEQLPVHRLGHKRQGTTYAFRSELDAWRSQRSVDRPLPAAPGETRSRRPRWWLFGVVAVGTLSVAILAVWLTSRRPASGAGRAGADTTDPEAFAAYAEGRALYAAREYQAAITSLERAIARDARFGSAWALLAKSHARLSQPVWAGGSEAATRAAEAARRAVEEAPNAADTHVALSLAARSRGDVAEWRAEAQRAVDLDPRAAEAYALLGDSYSSVVYACNADQDPERAEAYYRRALESMPDLTTAISNRAGNLRRMGRYAECVELLNRALRLFRDDTPLRATRGGCRLMMGDVAGATEDIGALRDNPGSRRPGRWSISVFSPSRPATLRKASAISRPSCRVRQVPAPSSSSRRSTVSSGTSPGPRPTSDVPSDSTGTVPRWWTPRSRSNRSGTPPTSSNCSPSTASSEHSQPDGHSGPRQPVQRLGG